MVNTIILLLECLFIEILLLIFLYILSKRKKEIIIEDKKEKKNYERVSKILQTAEKEQKTKNLLSQLKKQKIDNLSLILKIIVVLIPIIFVLFIFYTNFLASHEFNYFYDIGSEKDTYLSPAERVSDKILQNNSEIIDFRNLTNSLVYFDVPISSGVETINISIKFKDNFPSSSDFSLGAKDQEDWHYYSNQLYNPAIDQLIKKYPYEQQGNLYLFKLNSNAKTYLINDFLSNKVSDIRLATNQNVNISSTSLIEDYMPSDFEINDILRGSYTFYVYAKGDFKLSVTKKDLNWYTKKDKGDDILNVTLSDLQGNILINDYIKDDGITGKSNELTKEQRESFSASNLTEGVYKLVLRNNDDMIITNIKLNQNKIVSENTVYLYDVGYSSGYSMKNYKPEEHIIDTAFRENINFYVYVKGNLDLEVSKRDLNWYDNSDELTINLYDSTNKLISSKTIADDGIITKKSDKTNTLTQTQSFNFNSLSEGVYRLEFKGSGDFLITRIKLNQNKIYGYGNLFLASSNVYFNDLTNSSTTYFQITETSKPYAITYHKEGFQNLIIKGEKGFYKEINISQTGVNYYFDLPAGKRDDVYELISEKNDIIIKDLSAWSFSENGFFEKSPVSVYFKAERPLVLTARTYHKTAYQTLKIKNLFEYFVEELIVDNTEKDSQEYIPSSSSLYKLDSPKGDVILKGPEFFSFTEDSYFNPFEGKKVSLSSDIKTLEKTADYVLVQYTPVQDLGDGWKIATTSFDIKENNLFIKDNKLNMMFNTPHLGKDATKKYTIPIDWINITINQPARLKF